MTTELDSTQDADRTIKQIVKDLYLSSMDDGEYTEERLNNALKEIETLIIAHTDQVIGPDDPIQLASDAVGHIRYIQQVERNKLRSEQRKRNKA